MIKDALFLNLDGIPSKQPLDRGQIFFARDPMGLWRMSEGDRSFEIDAICVQLQDALEKVIMRDVPYEELAYMMPQFVADAGHDSESPVSRANFEMFLHQFRDFPEINRFLYLHDCQRIVGSIQGCSQEIIQILGDFYFSFNNENFFHTEMKHEEGVLFSSSPTTIKLSAYLSFIFVRLHSLLDYVVKIAIEAEHIKDDFSTYPRISCMNKQFGDRKRVSFNGQVGTLLENCIFINKIESLRNHIIHDGLVDSRSKAYERFEKGSVVEKFILFPDMTNGRFDQFKSRRLFYGHESKINLELPSLLNEFQSRQEATLSIVLDILLRNV